MKPNAFQKLAAEVYGGGDYAWISKSKNWRKDLDSCGDALFAFIMIELSSREGCETWYDAIARTNAAMNDLQDVLVALNDKCIKEKV